MEEAKKSKKSTVVVIILAGLVLLALIGWRKSWFTEESRSGYQAVFLANNQVYFGKISHMESSYPVLEDVYYLRVTQVLQPSDQTPGQQIQLMKLGGEIHGPENRMMLNKSQILFIEDLKPDSQIVGAIEADKKGQK